MQANGLAPSPYSYDPGIEERSFVDAAETAGKANCSLPSGPVKESASKEIFASKLSINEMVNNHGTEKPTAVFTPTSTRCTTPDQTSTKPTITPTMSPAARSAAYASFNTPQVPTEKDAWVLSIVFQIPRQRKEPLLLIRGPQNIVEVSDEQDWTSPDKVHALPVCTTAPISIETKREWETRYRVVNILTVVERLPAPAKWFLGGYVEEMRERLKGRAIVIRDLVYTNNGYFSADLALHQQQKDDDEHGETSYEKERQKDRESTRRRMKHEGEEVYGNKVSKVGNMKDGIRTWN
ncbi:hypothetical protein BJ508DRAFT_372740 [Ascobolus immersus RN42]|uniref:Uncharacterized protein n=1 Tax=Ascobolus immersus RN42 TaxID=1160509 RepID=A0A3N4IK15_ASCIM|nr:hypothetical protein BJ508DRAFT_372740 [Ascobolus immersus RN42]